MSAYITSDDVALQVLLSAQGTSPMGQARISRNNLYKSMFCGLGGRMDSHVWLQVGSWMYLPAPSSAPYASVNVQQAPEAHTASEMQQLNSRRKDASASQNMLPEANLPAGAGEYFFYVNQSQHSSIFRLLSIGDASYACLLQGRPYASNIKRHHSSVLTCFRRRLLCAISLCSDHCVVHFVALVTTCSLHVTYASGRRGWQLSACQQVSEPDTHPGTVLGPQRHWLGLLHPAKLDPHLPHPAGHD